MKVFIRVFVLLMSMAPGSAWVWVVFTLEDIPLWARIIGGVFSTLCFIGMGICFGELFCQALPEKPTSSQ